MSQVRRSALALLAVVLAMVVTASTAGAHGVGHSPKAVDPLAHQGRYQALAAEWWQWALSTPVETGGPFDAGTVRCRVNQPRRDVLFLAAPFNTSGSVDRTCTDSVGRGTRIFFPIINTECSNVEDPPFFGATAGARRHCVHQDVFDAAGLVATVDGHAMPVSRARFDVVSKDFRFTTVPGNPVGLTGPGGSTTRGVWLLLKPLTKGTHTISFAGSYPALDFSVAVTYRLTVR